MALPPAVALAVAVLLALALGSRVPPRVGRDARLLGPLGIPVPVL